jgi:nucleotide-binding universal stress UspA family protein
MMKTLLVCVDFSEGTDRLLAQAAKLARAFEDKIVLLHVAQPEPEFVGFEPGPDSVRQQMADSFHREREKLQVEGDELRECGVTVETLCVQGVTSEAILDHTVRLGADMILMGTHGHGALHHLLAGSICQAVINKSPCPVLLVPSRAS